MKVRQFRQQLQAELGREPSLAELEEVSGLSREDIVLAMEAGNEVESLYAAVYQDDGSEIYLVDKVVQGENGAVGSSLGSDYQDTEKEKLLNRILLQELLQGLNERERELIRMRYYQEKTQVEIAGILGISQVQVSRLEKKILLRMREAAGKT